MCICLHIYNTLHCLALHYIARCVALSYITWPYTGTQTHTHTYIYINIYLHTKHTWKFRYITIFWQLAQHGHLGGTCTQCADTKRSWQNLVLNCFDGFLCGISSSSVHWFNGSLVRSFIPFHSIPIPIPFHSFHFISFRFVSFHAFIHSFVDPQWLIDSATHWITESLNHLFVDSLLRWFTESLTQWLTQSLNNSFIGSSV